MKKIVMALAVLMAVSGTAMAADQLKATWDIPEAHFAVIDGFKLYQSGVSEPIASVPANTYSAIVAAPPACSEWYVRSFKGNKVSNKSTTVEWCQPGTVDPNLPTPGNLTITAVE